MPYKDPNALQLRIVLDDIKPDVWRRLMVPGTWHLGQLHLAIQAAFNWYDYHLHEFRIGGLRYGDPELLERGAFEDSPRVFPEREVRLCDFGREPGTRFTYSYDFGDDWRHTVEIEKVLALELDPRSASCIAGTRARPPRMWVEQAATRAFSLLWPTRRIPSTPP